MEEFNTRVEITHQLKDAVQVYAPDDEQHSRARKDDVIEYVVSAGHDRDLVREQYESLLRRGELYEVSGETVGVV